MPNKNKPLMSLGIKEFRVLEFIAKNPGVRWKVLNEALNLHNGQSFFTKLMNMNLIVRDVGYTATDEGIWFIKYVYNSPSVLNRLK